MVEQIVGNAEVLLTPEESKQNDAIVAARSGATERKADVSYQDQPNGPEQCSKCAMFVAGLDNDPGGACTEVISFRGPGGFILPRGWCERFEAK